jgi:hypothetical protein
LRRTLTVEALVFVVDVLVTVLAVYWSARNDGRSPPTGLFRYSEEEPPDA